MSPINEIELDDDLNVDENRIASIEDRLIRIEEAHQITRSQITRLNQAKAEVARLKDQVEKSASGVKEEQFNENNRLQADEMGKLNKQIADQHAEIQHLNHKFEFISKKALEETEFLKTQLEAAVGRQKQLEKEKLFLLRGGKNNFWKGMLIGLGISLVFLILVVVFLKYFFI